MSEWVIRIRELSASGCPLTSLSKVSSVQFTNPSGGFFFWILRSFFGS